MSVQDTIPVADTFDWQWDQCILCGSAEVVNRAISFSMKPTPHVFRVGWCAASECQEDRRLTGEQSLTAEEATQFDAFLVHPEVTPAIDVHPFESDPEGYCVTCAEEQDHTNHRRNFQIVPNEATDPEVTQ